MELTRERFGDHILNDIMLWKCSLDRARAMLDVASEKEKASLIQQIERLESRLMITKAAAKHINGIWKDWS